MPAPDLAGFLGLIERHRVTHTFLPPTLIYMLLDQPGLAATDLARCNASGTARRRCRPPGWRRRSSKIGPVMGAAVRPDRGADDDLHPGAAGPLPRRRHARHRAARPRPGARRRSPGRDHGRGRPAAAAGERGEIVVRGSLVMAGYYRNPEATAEAARHGWHHTGDIGYLDEDNYLFIVDRAKDMIITGGFNVYSTEVEQVAAGAPGGAGLRGRRPAGREVGRAGHGGRPAPPRPRGDRRRDQDLRQGADRQREDAQAGRDLARPAPLQGHHVGPVSSPWRPARPRPADAAGPAGTGRRGWRRRQRGTGPA